jgi:FkbM family methyltransferase
MDRLRKYAEAAANLGSLQTIHYVVQRIRQKIAPPTLLTVRSKHAAYPLTCRRGSSDLDVFGTIYSEREYSCLDHVNSADLIIDCGANVGFASAYFATRFPDAQVIAIEPDPGNYNHLLMNIAPYGARIKPVRAGVWSKKCGLIVTDFPGGDGREWGRCVREAAPGETPDVYAIDIASVLTETSRTRVSILKMDIEGGEQYVFAEETSWLELVDNLVIETHGAQCEAVVRAACERHGIDLHRFSSELLVGARTT